MKPHPRPQERYARPPPLPVPRRALAIGAHPDDIEFGAGGTLAKWASQGCEVSLLVVTDGSKGTWDRELDPAELIEIRKEEQAAAADVLGAKSVFHLDEIDGELVYTMDLRRSLAGFIRDLQPGVVLTHDPWLRYELHPDHRATGWAVIDAVVAARDHLFFPNLAPETGAHRPQYLLLWHPAEADHWEDIRTTIEVKIEALLCHASQGTSSMSGAQQDELRRVEFSHQVRRHAESAGSPVALEAAEAFRKLAG